MSETDIVLRLWGREVAAASWTSDAEFAVFQYDPGFAASGIELSPLNMPSSSEPYQFPSSAATGAKGLPGLLAASMPGDYPNQLLAWLQQHCWQSPPCVNPLDILGVIGSAGPGALEFQFAGAGIADARMQGTGKRAPLDDSRIKINPAEFVSLAQQVSRQLQVASKQSRECGNLPGNEEQLRALLLSLLATSSQPQSKSAQGALYLAYEWNSVTGECQIAGQTAGQAAAYPENGSPHEGFQSWLMKVYSDKQWLSAADAVGAHDSNLVGEAADQQTGSSMLAARLEYALNLMAHAARLNMVESRIQKLDSSGLDGSVTGRHKGVLAVRRVDRGLSDESLHIQSWSALSHDFAARQSTDDWMDVWSGLINATRRFSLQRDDVEQLFSQAVFLHLLGNTCSVDQAKSIQNSHPFMASLQFVMDKTGRWRLACPNMMFDSYIVSFLGGCEEQVRGRISRSAIAGLPPAMPTRDLLEKMASLSDIKPARARGLIEQNKKAFGMWTQFAAAAGLADEYVAMVAEGFVRQTEPECI